MNVVELSHPLLTRFPGKIFSNRYHVLRTMPGSSQLVWKRRAPRIHEKTPRSHEKALSEFDTHILAAFFSNAA